VTRTGGSQQAAAATSSAPVTSSAAIAAAAQTPTDSRWYHSSMRSSWPTVVIVVLVAAACASQTARSAQVPPHPGAAPRVTGGQTPDDGGQPTRKVDDRTWFEIAMPEGRPGRNTASRHHPFAMYIVGMHFRIHERWAGFLDQLEGKGADDPLNDMSLVVDLEIAINPDGTPHRVTIAKTSGTPQFDVAAADTVISAAPYEVTPAVIRSSDGRTYLHWAFYRDWRRCATFNTEPFILDKIPDDGLGAVDGSTTVNNPGEHSHKPPIGGKPVVPPSAQQTISLRTSVHDRQALWAANQWILGFMTRSVDKLVTYSTVPFSAPGNMQARNAVELRNVYTGLLADPDLLMKSCTLLTPAEASTSGAALPDGNLILQVQTAKAMLTVVLTATDSGAYRATQLQR
jgi:hypothetical protein